MKNILILICCFATYMLAQTNEPAARTFEWNGKTQVINPNDHIQRTFIRGFEMGQFKSFDDLLNCNSHFGSQFDKDVENNPGREYQPLFKFNHLTNHKNHELQYDPNATPDPIYNRGYNPYGPGRTWSGRDISLEGVAAIEWEPVLEVNESNWGGVFDDPYNSDNFVFGFSEISQYATKDPTYPGYLNLYKNNFSGETTVLENALVKPMFITHKAEFKKTTDTVGGIVRENIIKECTNFGDIRQMIGRRWYLSINIKLLEITSK